MDPLTITLLVNLGLVLAGALFRSHAPRLWPVLAPIFGAAAQASSPPQSNTPPCPGSSTTPTPQVQPLSMLTPGGSIARTLHQPTSEEHLEFALSSYLHEKQQGRRLDMLLGQLHMERSREPKPQRPSVPEPSAS